MDWSNESYVRLYVRDTTSWMRLGWDGQSLLMHLLRKVDRAGAIELDGLEPWEAVMLRTGAPESSARAGTAALLRVEVVVVRGDLLVFPNFIEAQECSKSDKQRQKESRARRAGGNYQPTPAHAQALADNTDRTPEQAPNVTNRDSMQSQNVTVSHERSQPVTIGHSLLCSALPCSALPCPEGERASAPTPPEITRQLPTPALAHQVGDLFDAEAHRRGYDPAPSLSFAQKLSLAERVIKFAKGGNLGEAAGRLLTAAFDDSDATGEKPCFAVMSAIPGKPAGSLRTARRPARQPHAAPREAFSDEDPIAQIERKEAARAAEQARLRAEYGVASAK